MKPSVLFICVLVSAVGIAAVFYLLGLTGKSLVISAIFLLCPVLLLVQVMRGVRQFDRDMAEAQRQAKRRNLS
jgi:ABC-type spermidine/putrescine transport system permease subunit II